MAYQIRFENHGRGAVLEFTGSVVDIYGRKNVDMLRYSVREFSRRAPRRPAEGFSEVASGCVNRDPD